MKIILASKSPRRKELLGTIFENFDCVPSLKEERVDKKLNYKKLAECLSEQKAEDIFSQTEGDRAVIGSDTMVVLHNKIFGKPKTENETFEMLKSLSGNTHIVVTGLCVIKFEKGVKTKIKTYVKSKVSFVKMSDEEIWGYIKTGDPMDKAGAYGCQGIGKKFIKKINGDFFAVMGLPVNVTYLICKQLNLV